MRAPWTIIVGAAAAVAGSVVWAVSLAIYQQVMEPIGFHDGVMHNAENNTYWPREMRHLGILLALAAVVLIGRAAARALATAGVLGVGWLAADVGLDRIDVDGSSYAVGLAACGLAAVALAAVLSRGGTPSPPVRQIAAGTAALLAVAPTSVTTPWEKPTVGEFEVPIDTALTTMKLVTAVAFMAVTVAMLAPALTTVRARWLVPVGAAISLAAAVPLIVDETRMGIVVWPVMALAATIAAAAQDVPVIRLLVAGGLNLVLTLVLTIMIFIMVAVSMGSALTALAGNPAVHGADFDTALALPSALLGLLLAAASFAVTRPAPIPSVPVS